MRYLLLPGESDDKLKGIVFGIHIRLIEEIHHLLLGASYQPLDTVIGWAIRVAILDTGSGPSSVQRRSTVSRALALLREGEKPLALVLRDVVQQGLGDPDVKSLLGESVQKLRETQAERPTLPMHHYLCTLEYRLPGLEPATDVQPFIKWSREEGLAHVHNPSGEKLGFIERRYDGTWLAVTVGGHRRMYVRFDDAVGYVVNKRTVMLLINGQAKRVMAFDSDAEIQLLGGIWREDATIELRFWDESHGLRAGDNVNIVQEGSKMVRTVDGKVTRVDGRKVSVLVQNDYWGVPSSQQNA